MIGQYGVYLSPFVFQPKCKAIDEKEVLLILKEDYSLFFLHAENFLFPQLSKRPTTTWTSHE